MSRTTQQIISAQRKTGAHAAHASEQSWVSTRSAWTDTIWYLDPPDPRFRASDCTVYWDPYSDPLKTPFKALLWSMLVSRPRKKPTSVSSVGSLSRRLQYLAEWMQRRRIGGFGEITKTGIAAYREDLKSYIRDKAAERDADYDTETIDGYFMPLQYAYEQTSHLAALGVPTLNIEPFSGGSAWHEASGLMPAVDGFIEPLPDEIVLPVIEAAMRFIEEPADDIMYLQSILFEERTKERPADRQNSEIYIRREMNRRILPFEFSTHEDESAPWHISLPEWLEEKRINENLWKPSVMDRVRRLTYDLVAACVIIIRFQSGIRHGEIFSFAPGLDDDGLPSCVEKEGSLSGAYDLFFVKGAVSKGWDHPSDTRWLIGARPSGSVTPPPAVRALQLLNQLYGPWREWSSESTAKDAFLIQLGFKATPSKPEHITPLASETLSEMMKDFVEAWTGLDQLDEDDERIGEYVRTRGRSIQSRQWRKTWANYVIRVNPNLLPAIAQQFKHISTTLTEEAYIGKDAMQLGIVESAAMERAARYMRRAVDGDELVGGGLRKAIDKGLDELKAKIGGLSGRMAELEVQTWLSERDVRMWPSPHGSCFIGLLPSESRCHERAGTLDWSNQTPNFSSRNPKLCSGCRCFGVDEEDIPFWLRRYRENKSIWDEAVERKLEVGYVVARERWQQSENVLKSLGIDVSSLENIDAQDA